MGFIFFIATIVLAISLSQKNSQAKNMIDPMSASYRQGYWDGVRAAEQGAAHSPEAPAEIPPAEAEHPGKVFAAASENSAARVIDEFDPAAPFRDEPVEPAQEKTAAPARVVLPPPVGVAPPPVLPYPPGRAPVRSSHVTINVALYVAVLLLVSGIILLAQMLTLSAGLRMVLVWLLIIVSYAAGLVLRKRLPIVRPAALALVSTALASVPVAGVTMYAVVLQDAALCWLITSLIGLGLYAFAALAFENQFLSYVSILSLFTASMSLPAVVDAHLVWYYVVMIAFGGAMTLLGYAKIPGMSKLFAQPIYTSSLAAVPLALVAALLSAAVLSTAEFTVVYAAGLLYYAAQALTAPSKSVRDYAELSARLLTLVVAGTAAAWVSDTSPVAVSLSVAVAALLNCIVSVRYLPIGKMEPSTHEVMLWVGFFTAAIVAPALALIRLQVVGEAAPISARAPIQLIELALVSLAAIYAAIQLRRYALFWPAVYVTLPLPAVLNYVVSVPHEAIIAGYIACAVAALALRLLVKRLTPSAGALVYVSAAIWLLLAGLNINAYGIINSYDILWWSIGWWALAAAVLYYVVVVEKLRWMALWAHGATLITACLLCYKCNLDAAPAILAVGTINAALIIAMTEFLLRRNQVSRTAAIYQYASIGYGAIFAVVALGSPISNVWRALVWLPVLAVFTHAAYRQKETAIMYVVQALLAVQMLLICVAAKLSYSEIIALMAWLPFAGFGAVSLIARAANRATSRTETWWRSGITYALTIGFLALISSQSYALRSLGWLAAVAAMYVLAHIRRQSVLLCAGNTMSVMLVLLLCAWCGADYATTLAVTAVFGLVGFYGAGWLYRWRRGAGVAWSVMLSSSLVCAILFGLLALFSAGAPTAYVAALVLAGAGAVLGVQSYETKRLEFAEGGAGLAMLGAQRVLYLVAPDTHFLIYTHLWAFVAAIFYAGYHARKQLAASTYHLVLLLSFVTFPGLFAAFADGGWYQLLFLAEHAAIVIAGVATARKLTSIWGAIGVTVAILYMLREFQALLNITFGLLVLAAVILAIVRANRKVRAKSE